MTAHDAPDRCPGVLRPHRAADGALVRVRVPGGRLPATSLVRLAALAAEHGTPFLQLTSRASLQLRGLPDAVPQALEEAVRALGLLPSDDHERARTLVAAPARVLDPVVEAVDAAVLAEPALAELPGRWLTVLADAAGTHLDLPFDVAWRPEAADPDRGTLLAGDRARGCDRRDVPRAVVDLMLRFLAHRPGAGTWNLRDLPEGSPVLTGWEERVPDGVAPPPAPGPTPDGRDRVVGVPLGLLTPAQADAVAAVCSSLVVTPARSLVLRDPAPGAEDALEATGLLTTPGHPLTRTTACIGAPHCTRTEVPTLAWARAAAEAATATRTTSSTTTTSTSPAAPPVHVVGCARACGRPPGARVVLPTSPDDVLEALDDRG
ncbi:cobalamin biosynthesis protein CobG [Kytococcus schroeteri]|uniref:cobalamin biosynthesis protein CobG n=2 Tax=Kytococcus schroeteri TaxID=138300 RepID=UPI001EE02781|nr:cobalamin biosynthesis protein CobG [Kytococcus schroeteri]